MPLGIAPALLPDTLMSCLAKLPADSAVHSRAIYIRGGPQTFEGIVYWEISKEDNYGFG